MKKQLGFSALEGLIIVFALTIIGFGGWYVWNQNQEDTSSNPQNAQDSESTRINNTDNESASTSKTFEETLFTATLPTGWEKTADRVTPSSFESDSDYTLIEYTNSDSGETIAVSINPFGKGVIADSFGWRFDYINDGKNINVTSSSLLICSGDDRFCGAGDDALDLFLKRDDGSEKTSISNHSYVFFYHNPNNENLSQEVANLFIEFVESVTIK